jgi:putative ABC transport system ATP-binding protein
MIKIAKLSMHYVLNENALNATRITVLHDIDLTIAAGERVAIVGPSGSGKTTLLLLLAGLEHPASGGITLNDVALDRLDRDQLADMRRERIGIVFQSFHLVPSLSALDNVALPLEIAGRHDARAQALQMLERVGLAPRRWHYPAQLSGGEQQRVAIARALVHRPQLVLADEPTGNLDDHTGAEITGLLFSLNRESGSTLVLVTHDMTLAERCDRILRLHEGRLSESLDAAAGLPPTQAATHV